MKYIVILLCALLQVGCAISEDLSGMNQQQIQKYRQIKKAKALEEKKAPISNKTPRVKLTIENGKAKMPRLASRSPFNPASMIVYQGHCQTMRLNQVEGDAHVDIEACYRGNELLLDASRYDYKLRYGTLRLAELPLWESGFTYHGISTKGYVKLSNSDITVKKLPLPE